MCKIYINWLLFLILILTISINRYYKEKVAAGPIIKRHGYIDDFKPFGLLPRDNANNALPMPVYK